MIRSFLPIAWRNLWRNYRRTAIMIATIAVGVWAMICMPAFMRGMVDNMVTGAITNFTGHIQIHHPDYRDDPVIANSMPAPSTALTATLEDSGRWTSRIRVPGVISSEYETRGVTLLGIDPAREAAMSYIGGAVVAGQYFAGTGSDGVIIGAELAKKLETRLGKRVVLMVQGSDNTMVDRGLRVTGVFRAELPIQEERLVFMHIDTAQQMLAVPGMVSEIEWQGDDYRRIDEKLHQLQGMIGGKSDVSPWYTLDPRTGQMLNFIEGFVLVWILIIFVALSFGLVNTLAMSVFERIREFGLLQALGVQPYGVVQLVMMEAVMLLAVGTALGDLLAALTLWWWADGMHLDIIANGFSEVGISGAIYLRASAADIMIANAVVLILGAAATSLPAARATRFDPVVALNKV